MEKCKIKIYVAAKTARTLQRDVAYEPFILASTPETLRDLIEESVLTCIRLYRERGEQAKNPQPLTDEELSKMREMGKLAFGVHYNEGEIDEKKAIETAITAVEDGIVRVFKDGAEFSGLDEKITVNEGDRFTFVRLTMLSGRMW